MSLKVKSTIKVPDIEIEIDKNNEYAAEKIIKRWGPNVPMVKINDYVVSPAEIKSYNVYVDINTLLLFDITINDENNIIKDKLSNTDYNKIVIFIGTKDWYHKYEGVILSSYGNDRNNFITYSGFIFPEKIFETKQVKYDEKTCNDILTNICKDTGIGLFINDNESINNKIPEIINPNYSNYNFIKYLISNYTDNIYSFDSNYILHVGNLQSFVNKNVSEINYYENEKLPSPIKLQITNKFGINGDNDANENYLKNIKYLKFDSYTIDDIRNRILNKKYSLNTEDNENLSIYENDLGIGERSENIFSEFKSKVSKKHIYLDIVNKQLTGKVMTVVMENNFYEIHPFQALNIELYSRDEKLGKNQKLKEKGKKIIIGYSYHYKKSTAKITQKLKLI